MFEKLNLRFLKSAFDKEEDVSNVQTDEFSLPLVNAKDGENGVMYYGRPKDFESAEMTIDIVNDGAISTGNVYPQPQKTGVLYNAYLISPYFKASERLLYFFAATIQKSIKLKFGYENKAGWAKVKEERIQLPTKNGEIDFAFMESFIAELEAERIAELEAERIAELGAYLTASGLKDYTLTKEEEKVLAEYETQEFSEFNVINVFDVQNTRNILSRDIVEDSGETPYLCASADNNAVSSYISYDEQYLDKGNCVFIGGKTFVVSYQEKDFYSNDSHNLALYLKEEEHRNKLNQLYLATCIKTSLGHKYSWGDSISNRKIQKDKVSLPTKDNKLDYGKMETFISAIHKLVIKDVVLFSSRKVAAYRKVVEAKV